jgi:hypothetical protein
MFAFSNQQFTEGKQKLGVTDNSELLSIGYGGYIRKTDREAYRDLLEAGDKELKEYLKEPEQLKDALIYELGNHEYCITYDLEPALEALSLDNPTPEQQSVISEAVSEYEERLSEANK